MKSTSLEIKEFLSVPGVVLDVRSPGEYAHARIPGALNLPLFNDAERAAVGTAYKQMGRNPAIEMGLGFVGPRLADFVAFAKQHVKTGSAKVHCWRGGMRSSSMAWLLDTAGLSTVTLKGGYKIFRRWALSAFTNPYRFLVMGGMTGSGKTAIMQELKRLGEQILDLEELASHRGSSYGMLGMPGQPSTEQFENEISLKLFAFDPARPIWVEDESRMIGKCKIPDSLFNQMQASTLFFIDCPLQERVDRLKEEYGHIPPQMLVDATERISRRLGGARTQEIVKHIKAGDLVQAIHLTLQYYDNSYHYGLTQREHPVHKLQGEKMTPGQWAQILISKAINLR